MSEITQELYREALQLPMLDRVSLVEKLISSLDKPDESIDKQWADEAESRIDAYERGDIKVVSLDKVFAKYKVS